MKQALIALTVAAIIAGPVIAQEGAPAVTNAVVTPAPDRDAAGVYQVFRVTDNQLNCEQLISEMNNLNAVIKSQTEAQAKAAPKGSGAGRQAAGGVLGGALGGFARGQFARNVPGLGYTGALAAAGASDAASAAVGNAVAKGGQPKGAAAPATASNEQQRLNRVSGLFGTKGC